MSFKTKKYQLIKNAIPKLQAEFLYRYILNKRDVAAYLFKSKYISPYTQQWGWWGDKQVPNTYAHYSDIAMETILDDLTPLIEKKTQLKLIPNYTYTRIYKKGDVLKRHKDRYSCEVTGTLSLGGAPWPIYIEPNKNIGFPPAPPARYVPTNNKGIKVDLTPGDLFLYYGCAMEHWRESFDGEACGQVFLHYTKKGTKKANENAFDDRPFLGLPKDVDRLKK